MDIRKGMLKKEQGIKKENLGAEGFLKDIMTKRNRQYGCYLRKKMSELKKKINESQAERIGEEEITK